jgi:hypothetical protein
MEHYYDLNPLNIKTILNQISAYYYNRPFFSEIFPIIQNIFGFKNSRVDLFNQNSIQLMVNALRIKTSIKLSSDYNFDKNLKGEERIIYIAKKFNAKVYINLSGGVELYKKENFLNEGINLSFIKMDDIKYEQGIFKFLSNLSIIDVLMNNGLDEVINLLSSFKLIEV